MIRIPGFHNSKCLPNKCEVKVYQKWDGYGPPMYLLLESFYGYLVDQKLKEMKLKKGFEKRYAITSGQSYSIHWIATVLKTPIEDYRKNALALILASYVINIKKLSYDEAFSIIKEWLSKCDELQPLDSKFDYRIKSSIGYFAEKNNQLHKILIQKVN